MIIVLKLIQLLGQAQGGAPIKIQSLAAGVENIIVDPDIVNVAKLEVLHISKLKASHHRDQLERVREPVWIRVINTKSNQENKARCIMRMTAWKDMNKTWQPRCKALRESQ